MDVGNLYLTANRILLSGKSGILRPDSEGYYELPIGGFNCENSIGEVYTMENVKKLFDDSGEIKTKIAQGKLMGEWGHPEMKPGEQMQDFVNRCSMVSDKETCVFFKDVWLDGAVASSGLMKTFGVDPNTVVTMSRLKPHGNKWESLQRALDDPNINIAFSVRNLSYDRTVRGVVYVIIARIITWDAVICPGIKAASKWLSPRLESKRTVITPTMVSQLEANLERGLVRQESATSAMELVKIAKDFYQFKQTKRSGYIDW